MKREPIGQLASGAVRVREQVQPGHVSKAPHVRLLETAAARPKRKLRRPGARRSLWSDARKVEKPMRCYCTLHAACPLHS